VEAADFLRMVCGRLVAGDPAINVALREIQVAANAGDAALGVKGIALPLTAHDGVRYVAHVLPLTSGARRVACLAYNAVAALFIRKAALEQDVFTLKSPIDYLAANPEQQLAQPPLSSWGAGGYAGVWLDESNDWIYRYLHKASERMIELARQHQDANGVTRRALNQASRELLLAQSSDWAFIIKTGTMVDYAVRRTREHLLRFTRLYDQLKDGSLDEAWLAGIESSDNLFPEIDYRVYRPA